VHGTVCLQGLVSDGVFGHAGLQYIECAHGRIHRVRGIRPEQAQKLFAESAGAVLDARGKLVLPAFIDSHTHLLACARRLLQADAAGVSCVDDLIGLLRAAPPGDSGFTFAEGLNAAPWEAEERARIRPALDAAFPTRPVVVKSAEQHSAWFNRAAWELAGVEAVAARHSLRPRALEAMRSDGRVCGLLYEALSDALYDLFTPDERRRTLREFLATLPALGVGGVHALVGYGSDPALDVRVAMETALSCTEVDVVVWPRTLRVELARELGLPRIGGCILVDGAIGPRTAALRRSYDDDPENRGVLYFTDGELERFAAECAAAGLQLCVHGIGDAAIEQVLSAYERLAAAHNLRALRPRVDHFCLATPQHCARAARLGVASSMQPAFDHYWGGAERPYFRALGSRALRANPLRTALEAGMLVGGGSDAPITPLDPRLGIYAACNHSCPQERLSFTQAVELFTSSNAELEFSGETKGRLSAGCVADFIVMPGGTTGSNIKDQPVLLTVHRGRIVYAAKDEATCSTGEA